MQAGAYCSFFWFPNWEVSRFPARTTLVAMQRTRDEGSPFGKQLRYWRQQRGMSQVELAALASTTPRYVSFVETGRSRPGRDVVLRLGDSLELPVRAQNELLQAAGLPPAYAERELDEEEMRPFRLAVRAMLDNHSPYPACAADGLGRPQMVNPTFRALWGDVQDISPEEAVDAFFGPGPGREMIENWAEVAWAYVDGRRREVSRTNDARLRALTERALAHLEDVPRPAKPTASPIICPRFRVGDRVIRGFTTVVRFEHAHEITISELRVELIFPMDDVADRFFRETAAARESSSR